MTKKQVVTITTGLLIAVCAFILYSDLQNEESNDRNASNVYPTQKAELVKTEIEPEPSDKVAVQEAKPISSVSNPLPQLPSYKNISQETYVSREQVLEFVANNIDKQNDDPTGKINLMLGKAFSHCASAPKTDAELEELKKMFESVSLENGANNGEIQESVRRAEDLYLMCKTLRETYPSNTGTKFLQRSSEIGNPLAKTILAAFYKPGDFDSWAEEKKSNYRLDMGKNLLNARGQCEPKAFEVIAQAESFEYGNTWEIENTIDENFKLAHLYAYNMIMSRKFSDGNQIDPARVSATLDTFKIDTALSEAEKIYKEFCVD